MNLLPEIALTIAFSALSLLVTLDCRRMLRALLARPVAPTAAAAAGALRALLSAIDARPATPPATRARADLAPVDLDGDRPATPPPESARRGIAPLSLRIAARYEELRAAAGGPDHCGGTDCFGDAPDVAACRCPCDACQAAIDLLVRAQDEVQGRAT